MKARPIALSLCACAVVPPVALAIVSACVNSLPLDVFVEPFDGGALGPCVDGSTLLIPAKECIDYVTGTPVCAGLQAKAICLGTAYAECECLASNAMMCDSGCCNASGYDYVDCTGKVVMLDPAEDQCDAQYGYLVCNGTCFGGAPRAGDPASFVCDIPTGYKLVTPIKDAGTDTGRRDGGAEAGRHDGGDAGHDGASDSRADMSAPDASDAAHDAPSDGLGTDARTDARRADGAKD
jgi:hypothetical protein